MAPLAETCRSVVGHGLEWVVPSFPGEPLDAADWSALVGWCGASRVVGLLRAACDEGAMPATDAQRATVDEAARHHDDRGRRILGEAATASAALHDRRIEHRFFKGVASASLLNDAGHRHYSDADVVVPPELFDAGLAALRVAGFQPIDARSASSVPAGVISVNLQARGTVVDLHRRVGRTPFAERIGSAPFGQPPVFIAGQLPALACSALGTVAAMEVAIHDRPVKAVAARDALRALAAGPDELRRTAREWKVEGLVAVGLLGAAHHLDCADHLPEWVSATPMSRRDVRLVEAFESTSHLVYAFHALRDLSRGSERRAYLRTLVPDKQTFQTRGGVRGSLRRQVRAASRLRSRANTRRSVPGPEI